MKALGIRQPHAESSPFAFLLGAILLVLANRSAAAEGPSDVQQSEVFVSGTDGYHTYRIPALAATNNRRSHRLPFHVTRSAFGRAEYIRVATKGRRKVAEDAGRYETEVNDHRMRAHRPRLRTGKSGYDGHQR